MPGSVITVRSYLFRSEINVRLTSCAGPDTDVDENYDGSNELHKKLYDAEQEHPTNVHYLLVCRVAMGYTLGTKHPKKYGPTQTGKALPAGRTEEDAVFVTKNHRELCPLKGVNPPINHHLLIADKPDFRFREFVVFHGDYVYP
eukprot:COSAG01_NODE_2440_length_7691_cov_12.311249_4_plen_144_part_00